MSVVGWLRKIGLICQKRSRSLKPGSLSRGYCPYVESLEPRTVPSGNSLASATPLAPNVPVSSSLAGNGAAEFWRLDLTQAGRLDALTHGSGCDTRLSLLGPSGNLLIQSDGQTPTNLDDLITQDLPPGTYYLEVQLLTAPPGGYTLTAQFQVASVPFQNIPVNGTPVAVATGDWNGDGHLDLVTANSDTSTVSILCGVGDGTFYPATSFPIGGSPSALTISDLNRDGSLDLVVASAATSKVYVYLGLGNGSFVALPSGPLAVGAGPAAVFVGDFNGDGRPDIVTANQSSSSVSVLLATTAGSFAPAIATSVGDIGPVALALGDFNGDGRLDVVTANQPTSNANDPRSVSILLGRGDGSFLPASKFTVLGGLMSVVAADFNGDGLLDLVTSQKPKDPAAGTTSPYQHDVAVWLGQGDGTFTPGRHFDVGRGPSSMVAVDFNGDGFKDVALVDISSGDVAVLLGRGDGTFADRQLFSVGLVGAGQYPGSLAVGDLNGDGRLDIVTGNLHGGTLQPKNVTVLIGRGDGTFQDQRDVTAGDAPNPPVIADFNNDGRLDMAVPNTGSNDISLLLGLGNGTFADAQRVTVGNTPNRLVVADFNRDGRLDLVSVNSLGNDVSVLLGIGDGSFQQERRYAVGSQPFSLVTADFNGDGFLDLAVNNRLSASISVLLGRGDGTFAPAKAFTVGATPFSLTTGDVNGDGIPDLLTPNFGSNTLSVLLGQRDAALPGGWTLLPQISLTVDKGPITVLLSDVNRDGVPDVLSVNRTGKTISLFVGSGTGEAWSLGPEERYQLTINSGDIPPSPADLLVTDFNQDGIPDLAVANGSGNEITVLLGQTLNPGAGLSRFATARRFAVAGPIIAPAAFVSQDFNGDGLPDLAYSNQNTNLVSVLLGQHASTLPGQWTFAPYRTYPVGAGPVTLISADFNEDGRLDLATANKFSDDVSLLLGVGDGTFVPSATVFNPIRSTPLVFDLNQDGAPDVVVVNSGGQILFRAGRPEDVGAFDPSVIVNPNPSEEIRDVAVARGDDGPFLVGLDIKMDGLSFYHLGANGSFQHSAGPLIPGILPAQLEAGDLNHDGRDDLIVTAAGSGQVFIFYQKAGGQFGTVPDQTFAVGVNPTAITLYDLDGEGSLDIAVADRFSADVSVIWNPGKAGGGQTNRYRASSGLYGLNSWSSGTVVYSADTTTDVVAGQFGSGPGRDLLVVNPGANTISLLPGTGHGFVNPQGSLIFASGQRPTAVVAGLFNADDYTDVAVLDEGSSQIRVFTSDAAGNFHRTAVVSAGNQPTGLSVADVNKDGKLDLIVGNVYGDVLMLLGNGDGTFQQYQRLKPMIALVVADLNKDGRDDFVLSDPSLDRVTVQYSGQTAGFTQARGDGLLAPSAVATADLNGDGLADLVVANQGGNDVCVYLGLVGGTFGPAHRFFAGTSPTGITVSDLDGNGLLDLVVANEGSNDVSILLGQGSGPNWTFTYGPRLNAGFDSSTGKQVGLGPVSTTVTDFNGDGILDILVTNRASNNVAEIPGTGNGFFNDKSPTFLSTGTAPVQTLVGNFDTAPGLDLVVINSGSNTFTFLSNLAGSNHNPVQISVGGTLPVRADAGDFNGDGALDLVVANNRDGRFSLFLGGPSGLTMAASLVRPGVDHPTALVLAATADGIIDVYATTEGSEKVYRLSFDLNPISQGISPSDPAANPLNELSSTDLELPATLPLLPPTETDHPAVPVILVGPLGGVRETVSGSSPPAAGETEFAIGTDNAPAGARFPTETAAAGMDALIVSPPPNIETYVRFTSESFFAGTRELKERVQDLGNASIEYLDEVLSLFHNEALAAAPGDLAASVRLPWRAALAEVLTASPTFLAGLGSFHADARPRLPEAPPESEAVPVRLLVPALAPSLPPLAVRQDEGMTPAGWIAAFFACGGALASGTLIPPDAERKTGIELQP